MLNIITINTEPTGLTLNKTLISQSLKRLGYKTHLVGKWHLGHCNAAYLPLNRGFDTHYGFWEGAEDYYTKVCTRTCLVAMSGWIIELNIKRLQI